DDPEAYDLMFIEKAPMEHLEQEDEWSCAMGTFEFLVQTVKECVDTGYFQAKDHMNLVFLAFASVHGMVTLHNRRHMKMFPPEVHENLITDSLSVMIDMMKQKGSS
ncbi:MAG: TetR-like C-terminal domain-containing protein, partial [Bacteroidota bacterium]